MNAEKFWKGVGATAAFTLAGWAGHGTLTHFSAENPAVAQKSHVLSALPPTTSTTEVPASTTVESPRKESVLVAEEVLSTSFNPEFLAGITVPVQQPGGGVEPFTLFEAIETNPNDTIRRTPRGVNIPVEIVLTGALESTYSMGSLQAVILMNEPEPGTYVTTILPIEEFLVDPTRLERYAGTVFNIDGLELSAWEQIDLGIFSAVPMSSTPLKGVVVGSNGMMGTVVTL